jgi:hypothetical protein
MNAALSERVPCHTCFGCLKGDLETLVYLHGELDCHAGALLAWRIPEKQLKAKTVVAYCEDMRIRPIDGEA